MHAHPAINELAKETYGAVTELTEIQTTTESEKLDEVRARFESAVAIFDRPMGELEDGILRTRSRAIAERGQFARDVTIERETAANSPRSATSASDLAAERKIATKLATERKEFALQSFGPPTPNVIPFSSRPAN